MFQASGTTGCLFLSGILAGCLKYGGTGRPAVFAGAMTALACATIISQSYKKEELAGGLAGFNAILVGCAAFTFLHDATATWGLLIISAILTLPLKLYLDRCFTRFGISSLTLPFIIATWALLYFSQATDTAALYHPGTSEDTCADITFYSALQGLMKGLSQVFLIDSWPAGCIFFMGLWVAERRAALWAVAGSAIGMATALCTGCPWEEIAGGVWGFSPALTSIALGVTFRTSAAWHWNIAVIAATVFTALLQLLLSPALTCMGLPVLTLPFCIGTWTATGTRHICRACSRHTCKKA